MNIKPQGRKTVPYSLIHKTIEQCGWQEYIKMMREFGIPAADNDHLVCLEITWVDGERQNTYDWTHKSLIDPYAEQENN